MKLSFMKKYYYAWFIVSGLLLLSLVAIVAYSLGRQSNRQVPISRPPISKISGVIIGITDQDIQNVKNIYTEFNQKFLVLDSSDQSKPEFYALYTPDTQLNSKINAFSNTQNLGTCVDVSYSQIIDKSLQNAGDYTSKVKLLQVENVTVRNDMDCLNSYATVFESGDVKLIDITARIMPSVRPAFDIGYDYKMVVPGAEAKKIGYSNSSGLEIKDSDSIDIFLVAQSSMILQKMEAAKRSAQAVVISGEFQMGFAESTFLLVTNVRPANQQITTQPSSAPISVSAEPQKESVSYYLPNGWKTAADTTGTFEVGYNPSENSVEQRDKEIVLGKLGPTTGILHIISLLPYDGGSRHNFIYKQMNAVDPIQDRMPGYYESEFVYNGWSCLVLHGFSYSASGDVHGMCAVDSSRAFMFFSIPSEDVVRTVRLLK